MFFSDEINTNLSNGKLYLKYFNEPVIVEDMTEMRSAEYLEGKARTMMKLADSLLEQAKRYRDGTNVDTTRKED